MNRARQWDIMGGWWWWKMIPFYIKNIPDILSTEHNSNNKILVMYMAIRSYRVKHWPTIIVESVIFRNSLKRPTWHKSNSVLNLICFQFCSSFFIDPYVTCRCLKYVLWKKIFICLYIKSLFYVKSGNDNDPLKVIFTKFGQYFQTYYLKMKGKSSFSI